jgi:sec-independent protein translocase protein TatC
MSSENLPILEHLRSLKNKVIFSLLCITVGLIPAYYAYDTVIGWLIKPFNAVPGSQVQLIVTHLGEGFLIKFKLCILLSIIITSPIHLASVITFIFPALNRKEKQVVGAVLVSGIVLAAISIIITYGYLIPFSIHFLTSQDLIPTNVHVMLQFKDNLQTVLNMVLMGIIVFQFPIVLELLMYLNLVKRKTIVKSTRYFVVLIFIIAAAVTPPDVISQVSFAIPMLILYGLTLLIATIMGWGEG